MTDQERAAAASNEPTMPPELADLVEDFLGVDALVGDPRPKRERSAANAVEEHGRVQWVIEEWTQMTRARRWKRSWLVEHDGATFERVVGDPFGVCQRHVVEQDGVYFAGPWRTLLEGELP